MADINESRSGYKETKVGWIPEEWNVQRLFEVTHMKSGETITGTHISDFSKYPCYGGNGLRGYTDTFTHEGNYVLIGRQGALCGNVLKVQGRFYASEHAIVVSNKDNSIVEFLEFLLKKMNLNRYSESSAQPGLSVSKLLKLQIPLPPLPEQKRIAEILSTWDDAIQKLDALIAKKQELKKGLMQKLLTGQLRFPEFVPAGGTKFKETKLGLVPEDWEVVEFGRTFNFLKGVIFSRSELTYEEPSSEIFCIHYGDIHKTFKYPFLTIEAGFELPKIVDQDRISRSVDFLESGDLVIADASEDIEGVGESIEIEILDQSKVLSGLHTIAARDTGGLTSPGYRGFIFQCNHVRNALRRVATGSNVFGISKASLKSQLIILPPVDEQIVISSLLRMTELETMNLSNQREMLVQQKRGLMQQLLTGAVRTTVKN
ncbi:MAG: restriction endonuclease subunit S [Lewinellaceae bacterium]|nr:restriction endonuclease subunit S [Lewinellaceae bacterium]